MLEAGCGTGRYVAALAERGYRVEGIDFAEETIALVRKADPTLEVWAGDIRGIERPDGYYAAYVSLGVVEHFFEGPVEALEEAFRVLRSGGVALIAVPYLNRPRAGTLGRCEQAPGPELGEGLRFYQYYFSAARFSGLLGEAGFEVVEVVPFHLFGGLVRDWAIGRFLHRRQFFAWPMRRLAKEACLRAPAWLRAAYAHMNMFVCRRP